MAAPNTRFLTSDLQAWRDVYLQSENGRRIVANAVATNTWEDLRFPATTINPPGQVDDPSFNITDVTLDFANNDTNVIFIVAQTPHSIAQDSVLRPHVHWLQTTTGNPNLLLQYKIFGIGDTYPASYTNLTSNEPGIIPYTSGTIHQLTPLGDIPFINSLSSIITMRFVRLGGSAEDTYEADWQLLELDLHYLHKVIGTNREDGDI